MSVFRFRTSVVEGPVAGLIVMLDFAVELVDTTGLEAEAARPEAGEL